MFLSFVMCWGEKKKFSIVFGETNIAREKYNSISTRANSQLQAAIQVISGSLKLNQTALKTLGSLSTR